MAWGTSKRGVEDLVAQLSRDCTAETMCVMRTRKFGAAEVGAFAEALATNTSLKELLLAGHPLDAAAAAVLGGALGQNSSLRMLTLGDSGFGDEALAALVAAGLGRNTGLADLDLEFRALTPPSARVVGGLLSAQLPPLRVLRLARNELGADAEALRVLLAGAGASVTLESLDLAENGLGEMGAVLCGELLSASASLKSLKLSSNKLGDSAATAGALARLVFGDADADAGVQGLQHGAALDLTSCGLGDAVATALGGDHDGPDGEALRVGGLVKLDLTGNAVGPLGAAALAAGLNEALDNLTGE